MRIENPWVSTPTEGIATSGGAPVISVRHVRIGYRTCVLLNGPSTGLDPITAANLDCTILTLRKNLGLTFVVVTHELQSILNIADCAIMPRRGLPQDHRRGQGRTCGTRAATLAPVGSLVASWTGPCRAPEPWKKTNGAARCLRHRQADAERDVRLAAAYGGNALVYRVSDVQYVWDPYNAFIAEAGAMLDNRIAEWLDRSGPFATAA